ncbi:LysR family transcriptional regulator [Pigmentiphaga litoralis]|nr:LysR family transcriptional regulator [Pigmentiphaga litoralis]
MEPTPHALALALPVQQALGLLNDAIERLTVFSPESSIRQFTLLMPDVAVALILPQLMERIATDAPKITIRAVQAPPEERAHVLQAGVADMAMWGNTSLFKHRIYRQKLWRHDYVCIARKDHDLLKNGLTVEHFAQCGHILVQSGTGTNSALEKALQRHGLKRRIALEVATYLGIPAILERTDLIVTVSATVASIMSSQNITIHPLPFSLSSTPVYLFWHERYHQDAGHVWLRRLLHELFHEYPGARAPCSA